MGTAKSAQSADHRKFPDDAAARDARPHQMALRRDTACLSWGVRDPKRIKSDAYLYASEGQYSPEIAKLHRIDRFGLEAITGRRIFYFNELRCLMVAENIVLAYKMRERAENWAQWANENKQLAKLLTEAEKLAND